MNVLKLKNDVNHNIYFNYNTRIKYFANGIIKLKYTNYDITKGVSNITKGVSNITNKNKTSSEKEKLHQRYKNLYNSKSKLIDLAYNNSKITPWEYFVTFTFDKQKINRGDYNAISHVMRKWRDNVQHQNPNLKALIVPEPHDDGKIHFHGLIANAPNLKLKEARNIKTNRLIYKNGSKIYNISNFKYGFTECSQIKNQTAVSVYISKYMTKNLIDLDFKKRYWATTNLERPRIKYAYLDNDTLKFFIKDNDLKIDYVNDNGLFATSYNV
ncbi:MAG: hypothetical protein PHR68_05620 [Candidatus Gracilibacteria bacterium]|nr:hypothetical protein [Candidatus Gracilibacteria bacterium]